MFRPRRDSSLRLRRLAALWMALYALGLFVATAHFSLVEHRVCEHGEVAHEGGGRLHAGEGPEIEPSADHEIEFALASAVAPPPQSPQPSQAPSPGHDDEEPSHEHCEFDEGTLVAPAFELAPLMFAEWLHEHFGRPAAHAPRPPAIAILRLAPGRSPPRA